MLEKRIKFGFLDLNLRDFGVFIFFVTALIILSWPWSYISMKNSEAFKFAHSYIESNQTVKEALGEIKSSRLGLINYKARYSGDNSTAMFHIVIYGRNKSGVAYFNLKGASAGWQIENAVLEIEDENSINIGPKN
jgi:hypothetical protein